MNFNIYIKTDSNGVPMDDWAFYAYLGFSQKGSKIFFFENIMEVPANRNNIVVAPMDETVIFFDRLGIKEPAPLNIPSELHKYTGRVIQELSLGDFIQNAEVPVFIKPKHKVGGFPSGVINKESSKKGLFSDYDREMPVIISNPLDIRAEYRGFVVDGKLKALHFYSGDFAFYPDTYIIEEAISEYHSQPAGYSIDFGVTWDKKTVLIECNDGWSLGSYGCDPIIYSNLLGRRWLQLLQTLNNA